MDKGVVTPEGGNNPRGSRSSKRKRAAKDSKGDEKEEEDNNNTSEEEYFSAADDGDDDDDEEPMVVDDGGAEPLEQALQQELNQPTTGMAIKKLFDDSVYYLGYVVAGPTHKVTSRKGNPDASVTTWRVRYAEDDDEEDMEMQELMAYRCVIQEPYVGMVISKEFDDGKYYKGEVVAGPIQVQDPNAGSKTAKKKKGKKKQKKENEVVLNWEVLYDDGEKEDLSKEELLLWAVDPPKTRQRTGKSPAKKAPTTTKKQQPKKKKANPTPDEVEEEEEDNDEEEEEQEAEEEEEEEEEEEDRKMPAVEEEQEPPPPPQEYYCRPSNNKRMEKKEIRKDLKYLVGISEAEIDAALSKMKRPPYGLNRAMELIHRAKAEGSEADWIEEEKFLPHIGMRIRKNYSGSTYYGTISSEATKKHDPNHNGREIDMWEVTFDDGDVEDMDYQELLESRASRPLRPHPVRGRQLCSLELFSGCGMVTQSFADRKWRVKSIDNSVGSYATNLVDIMDLEYDLHLGMIPDFIWASPPCFTYSLMAGGKHRDPKNGDYEKTEEARLNNRFLVRLMYIMKWAKAKKPHLVVVIENPAALLSHMPLMKEFEDTMGLWKVPVDYCTFGRYDKKPTHLWTNSFELRAALSLFTCKEMCPYNQNHSISSRAQGHRFNAAAIPQALAEEVAACVDAHFYQRRIRYLDEPTLTEEEKEEFNDALAKSDQEAKAGRLRRRQRQEEEDEDEEETATEPPRAAAAAAPATPAAAGTSNSATGSRSTRSTRRSN